MTVPQGVTTIAICMIIITAGALIATIALVYAIFAFKSMVSNKVDEALAKVQPVVDRAEAIAEQTRQTAESVSAKVGAIAAKAEDTANRVGDSVQTVSEKVESAISPEVVTIAGIVGTAARCVQIYQDFVQLRHGNGGRTDRVEDA